MPSKAKITPGMRLRLGASLLAAARAIDTRLVKRRLERFERAHRGYAAAQRRVEVADAKLRASQRYVAECDAIQDEAVEALARALVGDGASRQNPFAAFGVPAPGTLVRLPFAEAAKAVHRLVATLGRSETADKGTGEAARAAERAARVVEQALGPVETLGQTVRDARRMRDALVHDWHSALAALRRATRSAADDGAPLLHATLFPPESRRRTPPRRRSHEPSGAARAAPQPGE